MRSGSRLTWPASQCITPCTNAWKIADINGKVLEMPSPVSDFLIVYLANRHSDKLIIHFRLEPLAGRVPFRHQLRTHQKGLGLVTIPSRIGHSQLRSFCAHDLTFQILLVEDNIHRFGSINSHAWGPLSNVQLYVFAVYNFHS